MDIDKPITQSNFAALVGTSQPTVSHLVADGTLPKGATARAWITAHCAALEAERDASDGVEDSAEGREVRLRLMRSRASLNERQEKILAREHEAVMKRFVDNMLGEVQALLYRRIPNATVARLVGVITKQENLCAAAAAFRDVIEDAVSEWREAQIGPDGILAESEGEK